MTTPASTTASPPALLASAGGRHTRAILAIVLISYFMILLDNSIIFTALPKIHTAMRYSPTGLAWVQDAYTLVFGGLLLLGARAGDLLGRRRVFVFGLAVFALASLLVGITPTGWWLIAARALLGVGAASRVRGALNGRRPHRSRQLRPPWRDYPVADVSQKRIKRRLVLGGLINEYERAA